MRGAMATRWLTVAVVVAVACVAAVAAEELRAAGDFVAVHRNVPRERRFLVGKEEIGVPEGEVDDVDGDGERMQWTFRPHHLWHTFGVRREGLPHRRCGMAAKLRSWWSNLFGRHHDRDYGHGFHTFQHDEEHRLEHEQRLQFERNMEDHSMYHHRRYHHHHHHHHFGRDLIRKIGRWFSGIPSFISDVPSLIRTWSARVGGRRPPTVESVTEPLDMHSSRKPSSPSLSCTLRERLVLVFAAVAEEIVATSDGINNVDAQSDLIKSNMKKFMGDSMQLRIVNDICNAPLSSSCEQEFCDVFLSHPKSGVLMAFRVLGLNPIRAAINPEAVAAGPRSSEPLARPTLSPTERDIIVNFRKTQRLAHIVFQRVIAASPAEETVSVFMSKEPKDIMFGNRFGGEINPCKACLRQEIFRFKRLAKNAVIDVCENPADSNIEQSCKFVKNNKFLFKTLFAYKFRLWEHAATICRNRQACNSQFTSSTNIHELASNALGRDEIHSLRLAHVDVNTFRDPRGAGVSPFMSGFNRRNGLTCRQRALHRAAMLRGHALDAIVSEFLKPAEIMSLQLEHDPIVVVEFSARPFGPSSLPEWRFLHNLVNIEPGVMLRFEQSFPGSVESEPFRDTLKNPVVDSIPVHTDEVVEDAVAKPRDVQEDAATLSTAADVSLELPSSAEANGDHPDM